MGNPLQYLGMQMEWEKGHQLKHITGAGLDMYCMYNDSGKRIRKTVNGVTTDFYLDGSAILMQTSSDGSRIDFFYDDKGNVFAMKYQNEMYFYRKNLFGDILGILDSHGTELVKYEYNSWGKLLNLTDYSPNGLGRRNPFRFKGYYYDEELGMYYLNSRYYDPETGRFVNADRVSILAIQKDLCDRNLYVYCDNNPIVREDEKGALWASVAIGVATQYAGDVIGNVLHGKKGVDIFKPTSTIGEYISAGVTALIPGSGRGAAFLRNCVSEGIKTVEKYINNSKKRTFIESALMIALGTATDVKVEKLIKKTQKYIRSKGPKNYSSYAGKQYKKNPRMTKKEIEEKMAHSVRWGNRLSNGVEFVMSSMRGAMPW